MGYGVWSTSDWTALLHTPRVVLFLFRLIWRIWSYELYRRCSSERARRFGGVYRLRLQGRICRFAMLISCSVYSLNLKMDAICSSETSDYLRTARR